MSTQDYDCPIVSRIVKISIETRSLRGQHQIPVMIGRLMTHCTGNATCGKFPYPASFKGSESYGCPAH